MNAKTETPKNKMQLFREELLSEKMRNQIALALPEHIKLDRMLRIILTTVQKTPAILGCSRVSVLGAIMQSAQLGLEPDNVMGHCYLIPYGGQCQLVIGYKGFIELARRSGLVSRIRAHVVHAGDYFKYELGLQPRLEHIPADMLAFEQQAKRNEALAALSDDPQDAQMLLAAYAVVDLKDGGQQFEVVTRSFVQKIRAMSKSANSASSPWNQWEDAMWRKTAIKQALKYVPLSPEDRLTQALTHDEQTFTLSANQILPDAEALGDAASAPSDLDAAVTEHDHSAADAAAPPPAGPTPPADPAPPKKKKTGGGRKRKSSKAATPATAKAPTSEPEQADMFQGGDPELQTV